MAANETIKVPATGRNQAFFGLALERSTRGGAGYNDFSPPLARRVSHARRAEDIPERRNSL